MTIERTSCIVVSCNDCGTKYDVDRLESVSHFTDENEFIATQEDDDPEARWERTDKGEHLCPQCSCGRTGHQLIEAERVGRRMWCRCGDRSEEIGIAG